MNATTCPQCGKPASGNFCANCGGTLGAQFCNECGAQTEPGSRFCNQCGKPLGREASTPANSGTRSRPDNRRPVQGAAATSGGQSGDRMIWWVAGAALVGLLLIVAYPVLRRDNGPAQPAGVAPSASNPAAGMSSVDLNSMTPREAADRLFDRVMRADAAGDSTQVVSFLPMAISAYDMVQPLDPDASYHLAVLKQTAADFEGALAAARIGLEENPDHLLNLVAAARAQQALGDLEGARQNYSRLLEVWDEQQATGLEDYAAHAGQLPEFRAEAESFLDP